MMKERSTNKRIGGRRGMEDERSKGSREIQDE